MSNQEVTGAPSSRLLDVREAALLLNVSKRTVYALVERGEVPHAWVGGQIRFVPSVLEQWLRDGGASKEVA